jgi:hypothetical protein
MWIIFSQEFMCDLVSLFGFGHVLFLFINAIASLNLGENLLLPIRLLDQRGDFPIIEDRPAIPR